MDAGIVSKNGSMVSGDGGGAPVAADSGQFPAGLRVLVVDDDPTCLKIIEKMLRSCQYEVTTCTRAIVALSILREKKGGYDVVLSDVHMPDVDGFKLLECIGLEMDLPVIMMSADDCKEVVLKGVTHGACDYLIKPVRLENAKNIWQHVVRKMKTEQPNSDQLESVEDNDRHRTPADDVDHASSINEGCWKSAKRRMDEREEQDEVEQREDPSTLKKPRVVWTVELHQQFVGAVNQLGVDKAVPKKILELMNVPGLTRENVASHLQKYRLYLRRVSTQQQNGTVDAQLSGSANGGAHGSISTVHGFNVQALAATGQVPQNLSNLQAVPQRAAVTPGLGLSAVDQIAYFNSDAASMGYTSGQEWGNKSINLIRPANMEQIHSQQMLHRYGNISVQANGGTSGFLDSLSSYHGGMITGQQRNSVIMRMTQQGQQYSLLQQGHMLNGIAAERNSRLSSTVGHQMLSNGISGTFFGSGGVIVGGDASSPAICYTPNLYAGFPSSCVNEPAGNFSLLDSIASSSTKSTFQESMPIIGNLEGFDSTTNSKGVNDFIPSYDTLSGINQSRSEDWRLQNIDGSYESGQQLSLFEFSSSLPSHQSFIAANGSLPSANGNNINTCTVSKEIYKIEHKCIAQHDSTVLVENSVRVKAQSMPNLSCGDPLFANDVIPDDLMSDFSSQHQDWFGEAESGFNVESYSLDDILT